MKRAAVLAVLTACSSEPTEPSFRPLTPAPVLDVPEGVRRTLGPSWMPSALVATDETVLLQRASGAVSELSAEGDVLVAPAIPSDAQVLCAAGRWVGWWSARGIGRRTPSGQIEEQPFSSPQSSYLGIVADARGIYWLQRELGRLEVWGWTSGPPARIEVPIPTTFELVAVDVGYVYGSEALQDGGGSPLLVRYAIAGGSRELLVERERYDYQSLPPFVVNGDRLLYERGSDLFVYSLQSGSEAKLGTIPVDGDVLYYGAIALDDRYAWFGKYRLSDEGVRHYLGAPGAHHVSDLAVIGDRIAWLTEEDGDGLLDGQPSQLFIADVDAMLE